MEFFLAIGVLSVMLFAVFSFEKHKKRDEYRDLINNSKLKYSLNLVPLLAVFFRKQDDPLRPAHVKLAKVGLVHFFLMLLGIFCFLFFSAVITVLIDKFL